MQCKKAGNQYCSQNPCPHCGGEVIREAPAVVSPLDDMVSRQEQQSVAQDIKDIRSNLSNTEICDISESTQSCLNDILDVLERIDEDRNL